MKNILDFILLLIIAIGLCVLGAGCTSLESKAVGIGGGIDGLKLETVGSLASGTLLPNLILGGALSSIATAPVVQDGDKTQIVFVMTCRNSFFGSLFGIDASTKSISYIGAPNETAAETAARFEAFAKVLTEEKKKDAPE